MAETKKKMGRRSRRKMMEVCGKVFKEYRERKKEQQKKEEDDGDM